MASLIQPMVDIFLIHVFVSVISTLKPTLLKTRRRAQEAHKQKHCLLHFSSHSVTYIILTLNRYLKRFYSNSIDRSALW